VWWIVANSIRRSNLLHRIDSLQRLMQSAQANDLHLPAQSAQAWQALATL
jgi:hypothetical protein